MKRAIIASLLTLVALAGQAQNQYLERLFQRYRNNPAIEYENLLDSFPDAKQMKVAESFTFDDSTTIANFVEEYEHIKNIKKLKASKVLKMKCSLLMKMLLNKAITIHLWEDENGYKDTVIEFDGCVYAIIHLGGFYKEEEIKKFITLNKH